MQERLPWEPLLTDEEVQRAQGYYGSGSAMRRAAAKLLAGQPIKVTQVPLGAGWWEGGRVQPRRCVRMGAWLTPVALPVPVLQVVTLGGSITRGTGATQPSRGYTSLFFSWINATFPHRCMHIQGGVLHAHVRLTSIGCGVSCSPS